MTLNVKQVMDNLSKSLPIFNFGQDKKEFETQDGKEIELSLTPIKYFGTGKVFPIPEHRERIDRYKRNKKLFKGQNFEVFKDFNGSKFHKDLLYVSVNIAGIICKKSADFLFGEEVQVKAGNGDSTPEQQAFDRFIQDNDLNIVTYESALSNAYRGDSFVKVRYGQEYGGELPTELDPPKVIIEPVNPEHVFPETSVYNKNQIIAYHIAVPVLVDVDGEEAWQLFIESHYAGRIEYRVYNLEVTGEKYRGGYLEITEWKILDEVEAGRSVVYTGVPIPLVVHIPNFGTDDTWEGLDDISEHIALLDEINNRLTQIADILDKHADPAMAVPSGTLGEDEDGNPQFKVAQDKVFEVMGKEDVIPQYITWNGQLQHAFMELDKLVDLLLTTAEIPAVAVGRGDSGTSGTSGLAIKWRMNSLLAKINRKRQYYAKGLKQIFTIAQLLEGAVGKMDYEFTVPQLIFHDGLPKDDSEEATVMNIRTGGAKTLSQKTAIMRMENMTEEQAEIEIQRINDEADQAKERAMNVDSSIFNEEDYHRKDTEKNAEGNPVTDEANKDLSVNGAKKQDDTG